MIYSDGDWSTGETDSMYELQDGRLGVYSDGDSILDPHEPRNRVAIFMAGTQPILGSTASAAMTIGEHSHFKKNPTHTQHHGNA